MRSGDERTLVETCTYATRLKILLPQRAIGVRDSAFFVFGGSARQARWPRAPAVRDQVQTGGLACRHSGGGERVADAS